MRVPFPICVARSCGVRAGCATGLDRVAAVAAVAIATGRSNGRADTECAHDRQERRYSHRRNKCATPPGFHGVPQSRTAADNAGSPVKSSQSLGLAARRRRLTCPSRKSPPDLDRRAPPTIGFCVTFASTVSNLGRIRLDRRRPLESAIVIRADGKVNGCGQLPDKSGRKLWLAPYPDLRE
jgi:hypothetical protein